MSYHAPGELMGLIASHLTHNFVYQVCDRRLNDPAAGRTAVETANKAVDYCGLVVFSFTGLAAIEGLRTDLWLSNVLNQAEPLPLRDLCEIIRLKAAESFWRMGRYQGIEAARHTFVGVGWNRIDDGRPLPVLCAISNFEDASGNPLKSPLSEFALELAYLEPGNPREVFALHGESFADKERLRRYLHKRIGKGHAPEVVVGLIAEGMRQIANHNLLVGKNLMAVTFPRTALGSAFSVSSQALRGTRTYEFLPEGEKTGIPFAPQVVTEAGAMIDLQGKVSLLRQESAHRFYRRGDPVKP